MKCFGQLCIETLLNSSRSLQIINNHLGLFRYPEMLCNGTPLRGRAKNMPAVPSLSEQRFQRPLWRRTILSDNHSANYDSASTVTFSLRLWCDTFFTSFLVDALKYARTLVFYRVPKAPTASIIFVQPSLWWFRESEELWNFCVIFSYTSQPLKI